MRPGLVRLLVVVFLAPVLHGATFVVSNTNDSGPGSLRQAVLSANASAGADVVDLTGIAGTILLTSGEIQVADTLTIDGPGAQVLAVSGGGTSRVINLTAGDLAINELTLRDGFTTGSGGAISAQGSVSLEHMTLSDNRAYSGGGLVVYAGAAVVRHSTVTRNQVTGGGGGIATSDATALIEDSLISSNTAYAGGGLYLEYKDAQLNRVRVEDNTSSHSAGGIWAFFSRVDLTQCVVARNTAGWDGGGLGGAYRGVFSMDETRIIGNQAERGGGIWEDYGLSTITRSEISGNYATIDGGGIWADARIENSTLSGNSAARYGGAVALKATYLSLVHTTIVGNQAAQGGGIFLGFSVYVTTMSNSILAGNTAASGPDFGGSGALTATYSVIQNTSSTATLTPSATNRLGIDPRLGPLQDNGGLTRTHLPLPDSPVIDAAGPATPPLTHQTDQRALARPFGPASDIGAVEVQESAGASDVPALTPPVLVLLTILCGVAGVVALRR